RPDKQYLVHRAAPRRGGYVGLRGNPAGSATVIRSPLGGAKVSYEGASGAVRAANRSIPGPLADRRHVHPFYRTSVLLPCDPGDQLPAAQPGPLALRRPGVQFAT